MSQDATASIIRILYTLEFAAPAVWNPVVSRQAAVDERIVGGEKLEEAAILVHKMVDERLHADLRSQQA